MVETEQGRQQLTSTETHHDTARDSSRSELQDEFEKVIYHITHDLRATLRAIKTVPEWIREDLAQGNVQLCDGVTENLSLLETHATRADQMLVDLRTYSRVGRNSDKASSVSFHEAIESATSSIGLPSGIELTLDLGAGSITAPRNEVEMLFATLISNAVKHHDRDVGQIDVKTTAEEDAVLIVVEDDGPGIPVEHHDRVFELMTTLKARDECEGSGVGLPLARKILHRYGGSIRLSETGTKRGCRLEIRWPSPTVS